MTGPGIILLVGWISGHLLVIASIVDPRGKKWLFLVAGMCFLLIYLVKPYTYDLSKYSIFFNTGFIQTENWGWNISDTTINLHPKDRTGEPFSSGFSVGFRLMAKMGNAIFPSGGLIPRFDPDNGKFGQGGAPPSDAMLYFIMALGFILLYISVKLFSKKSENFVSPINVLYTAPIILGSIFFVLGSQNILRQFLGIALIMLAISVFRSNRYVAGLTLIIVSGVMHKWAPFVGIVWLLVIMLGETRSGTRDVREIHPTRLERQEILVDLYWSDFRRLYQNNRSFGNF